MVGYERHMKRDPTPSLWRECKARNSQAACVEVADLPGGRVVQDSKDPDGARLSFTAAQWSAFTPGIRGGQFG